jgi:hypothetical protein
MFHASTLRWRKNLTITAILCFFTGIGTTQKFSDRVLEHRDGRSTGIPADVKTLHRVAVRRIAVRQFHHSHVPVHAAVGLSRSVAKSGLHGRLQR